MSHYLDDIEELSDTELIKRLANNKAFKLPATYKTKLVKQLMTERLSHRIQSSNANNNIVDSSANNPTSSASHSLLLPVANHNPKNEDYEEFNNRLTKVEQNMKFVQVFGSIRGHFAVCTSWY